MPFWSQKLTDKKSIPKSHLFSHKITSLKVVLARSTKLSGRWADHVVIAARHLPQLLICVPGQTFEASVSEVPGSSQERDSDFLGLGGRLKMSSLMVRSCCRISPNVGLLCGSPQQRSMRHDNAGSASLGICSLAFPQPTAPTT